jgi:hypothetical protein
MQELPARAAARNTLHAELDGSTVCTAVGITARGTAPVLALCRQLLAAGLAPDRAVEVFRGATLALRVRSIGAAAKLAVEECSDGRPRFRPYRPHPSAGAPPIAPNDCPATPYAAAALTVRP